MVGVCFGIAMALIAIVPMKTGAWASGADLIAASVDVVTAGDPLADPMDEAAEERTTAPEPARRTGGAPGQAPASIRRSLHTSAVGRLDAVIHEALPILTADVGASGSVIGGNAFAGPLLTSGTLYVSGNNVTNATHDNRAILLATSPHAAPSRTAPGDAGAVTGAPDLIGSAGATRAPLIDASYASIGQRQTRPVLGRLQTLVAAIESLPSAVGEIAEEPLGRLPLLTAQFWGGGATPASAPDGRPGGSGSGGDGSLFAVPAAILVTPLALAVRSPCDALSLNQVIPTGITPSIIVPPG